MKLEKDELTDVRTVKLTAGYRLISGRRVQFAASSVGTNAERFLVPAAASPEGYRGTVYSPLLEETGLFRTFAETELDERAILKFANAYGLLGGNFNTAAIEKGKSVVEMRAESLGMWKHAIAQMQSMLLIWNSARDADTSVLSQFFHWNDRGVYYSIGDRVFEWIASPDDVEVFSRFTQGDLILPAMYLLQRRINLQLIEHQVTPKLLWHRGEGQLVMRVSANSLIGAMWLQFAKAVEGNRKYRQCQRQQCRKWFEVGQNTTARSDKKFCSPTCKSAAHREQKKEAAQVKTKRRKKHANSPR
jgi:hypothetical protein